MAAIVGNPKSVQIPEVDAAQLSRVLDDVALALIGFTELSVSRGTIEVHDNGPPNEGAGLPPPWGRRSPFFHDRYTLQRPLWLYTHHKARTRRPHRAARGAGRSCER